jgi:hypothetical protein
MQVVASQNENQVPAGYVLVSNGTNADWTSQSGLSNNITTTGNITAATPGIFIRQGTGTAASLSNLQFQAYDTQTSYIQSNVQNLSNNAAASSDHIVTNDVGSDTTNYGDFGINSSGWGSNPGTFNNASGVYLYAQTGDLTIGTVAVQSVYILTGNTLNTTYNASGLSQNVGYINVHAVGKGLQVMEGTNAKQGTCTLAAGTVTVSNTSVTANSRIILTIQNVNSSTAIGVPVISARTAGTSFTVTSITAGGTATQTGDLSTLAYEIFEPGV